MTAETVLLDTNVFTAWLKPRSTLVNLYGKHVFGRRVAISQQTVAEARYGAVVAGWGAKRLDTLERLVARANVLPMDETPRGPAPDCGRNAARLGMPSSTSTTTLTCG